MNSQADIFDAYTAEAAPVAIDNQCRPPQADVQTDSPTPRPLFNGRAPAYTLQSERPEHRAVIMLKAAAMTNREIAGTLGKTEAYVAYIVKQQWAQEQILREIENAGREPVIQLLRTSAYDAANRLVAIAESAENDETRRKANNDILDRVFGKPNQKLEVTEKTDPSTLTDAELLKIANGARRN